MSARPGLDALGGPHRLVADVMTREVVTVPPSTSVRDLAHLLRARAVSAVPVVDENGLPLGVVSEADLLVKERELAERHAGLWVESHPGPREQAKAEALDAGALMTAPPVTILGDQTVAAAARRLDDEGVRRLLVIDHAGRLIGVVSRRDLLRAFEVDDAEIRLRVLRAIAPRGLWTDLAAIDVSVDEGVVTLRGAVRYRSDAAAIAGLARAVEGIAAVRDELTCAVDDVGDPGAL